MHGQPVRIVEETDYPFGEEVRFTVHVARPLAFTLHAAHPKLGVGLGRRGAARRE